MHVGLWDYLSYFWPALDAAAADDPTLPNATALRWGVAVHPYDDGDPRHNLSAAGIYTFATLAENVADVQCAWLGKPEYGGVPPAQCGEWPQTQMYASEQGWPYNNVSMTKDLQVRVQGRARGCTCMRARAPVLCAGPEHLFRPRALCRAGGLVCHAQLRAGRRALQPGRRRRLQPD